MSVEIYVPTAAETVRRLSITHHHIDGSAAECVITSIADEPVDKTVSRSMY